MKNPGTKIPGLNVPWSKARVVERNSIGVNRLPVWIENNNRIWYGIRYTAKFALVSTELFFSPLSIINIYVRSIPVDYVAKFVAQRVSPKQEPSILSVEA